MATCGDRGRNWPKCAFVRREGTYDFRQIGSSLSRVAKGWKIPERFSETFVETFLIDQEMVELLLTYFLNQMKPDIDQF